MQGPASRGLALSPRCRTGYLRLEQSGVLALDLRLQVGKPGLEGGELDLTESMTVWKAALVSISTVSIVQLARVLRLGVRQVLRGRAGVQCAGQSMAVLDLVRATRTWVIAASAGVLWTGCSRF